MFLSPVPILDVSFIADADIGQYLFASQGAAEGSVKVPTSAAEAYKTWGITQFKGTAGKAVVVRIAGTSLLVANVAWTAGANIGVEHATSADRGKGRLVSVPSTPTPAATPTAAEVNAVTTYATAVMNYIRDSRAQAIAAAAAQNDYALVRINSSPF